MNISGMVLGLIGGLGLFLYGMTLMSDSLEKAAVPNSVVSLNCSRRTDMWVSLWALCLRRLYSPPVLQRLWLSAL